MKLSVYKSYDDLPLFLNAKMVAQVLGVSISTAYELLNDPGFPTLRVGSRMVGPKEKFILWAEGQMRKQHWPKRAPIKNYFPLPNEIFSLGLSAGAIAVYGFLLHREDRRTYQCVASYRTIGEAVGMSVNTVRKYVTELEDRGLIRTERTTVTTRDGRTLNGCLRYYILPIQMSIEQFYARQLHAADLALERQRVERRMAALERKECASGC